jgi:hypothetical protein
MGLLLTLIAGLVIWLITWAFGIGGFDGFMILVAMVTVAATLRVISPHLPGNRS